MKIEIPAEKLAAAVNKILIPALIRKLSQEQNDASKDSESK